MALKQSVMFVVLLITMLSTCDGWQITQKATDMVKDALSDFQHVRMPLVRRQEEPPLSTSSRPSTINLVRILGSEEDERIPKVSKKYVGNSKILHETNPEQAGNGRQKVNRIGSRGRWMNNDEVRDSSEDSFMNKIYKNDK